MALRYRQVLDTPATVIAGEAAIVTPDDQRLHLLDDVGTEVWQLCEGAGLTLDELMTCLRAKYEGDEAVMERDTRAFLDEALSCGLLVTMEDGSEAGPAPG